MSPVRKLENVYSETDEVWTPDPPLEIIFHYVPARSLTSVRIQVGIVDTVTLV